MNNPARILYLSGTGARMGGATVSRAALVERLDRSQFEPYALVGSDGEFADVLRGLGADVTVSELKPIVRSYNPFILLRCVLRLIMGCRSVMKVCRKKRIDVVHANDNTVVFFAVIPAMLTGRKCAWHVRSPVSRLGHIGAFLIKRCDALIFCSQSNAEPFKKFFPKFTEKIFIAYEGVDIPSLVERSQPSWIRAQHDIPADAPLVGIVGRIARIKGQDEFLKAAVVVSKLYPKARFVVGGGPVAGSRDALAADTAYEREIKALADRLGVAEKVIFTGYRHNIPAAMKELDVLVVPSRREGLGLVALEAMALGVPVVVSGIGGLREIVENEVNGLSVPVDAAGALGMAISRLLKDRALAKRLAEEGKRTVETHFSADTHASTVADVYRVMTETNE